MTDKDIELLPVNHSFVPQLTEEAPIKTLVEKCARCGQSKGMHIDEVVYYEGEQKVIGRESYAEIPFNR